MPRTDLKPCPFCGAKNVLDLTLVGDRDSYVVRCFACHADGPPADTRVEAMQAWNTRAEPEPAQQSLELST